MLRFHQYASEADLLQVELHAVHAQAVRDCTEARRRTAIQLEAWRASGGSEAWATWVDDVRRRKEAANGRVA